MRHCLEVLFFFFFFWLLLLLKMKGALLFLLVISVTFGSFQSCAGKDLKQNFYRKTCPNAEKIVREIVWKKTAQDIRLGAPLLRMHFHDCFVRGCDASILLNSTTNNAERDAVPNQSLIGFDVIDEVKAALEQACPGIVSCADVIALAARDAVSFKFKRSLWEVETGRRDGSVSLASEVLNEIPTPFFNFTVLRQRFTNKNLTVKDLVVLSGAHTIGDARCNSFSNRLYNFTGVGDADPSLNPTYADFLRTKCRSLADNTTTVEMDPNSSTSFDTSYFKLLIQNKGLFQSDAALITNGVSRKLVNKLTSQNKFLTEFRKSMKKLSTIQVLTGTTGEIRKVCSAVNS